MPYLYKMWYDVYFWTLTIGSRLLIYKTPFEIDFLLIDELNSWLVSYLIMYLINRFEHFWNNAFKKVDGLNYVFASSSQPGSYNFSLSWVEGWSPAISFQNSRSRKIGTSRHPHRWAAMRFLDESDLFCHSLTLSEQLLNISNLSLTWYKT